MTDLDVRPTAAEPAASPTPPETDAPVRNKYADKMNRPRRRLPRPVRIGLIVALLAALIAGAVWVVRSTRTAAEEAGEKTAFASRGMLETYIEGSGMTAAKNRAELGKDLKGKVLAVHAQPGDPVSQGTVLAEIDPTDMRKELEAAQTALTEAQKSVTAANKAIADLTVTAPFTGRMLPPSETGADSHDEGGSTTAFGDEVRIQADEEVSAGTVLGTLVDDTTMKLELYFSYAYIDSLKTGAAATVSIPQTMGTVTGQVDKVERIEKISDEGGKLFRATVTFRNPGTLKAGMAATATIAANGLNIAPTEAGKLAYNREMQIVAKASGKAAAACNPSYYSFTAGQTILRLTNEETAMNLQSAQELVKTRQEAVADLQKRIDECKIISPIDGVVLSMNVTEGAEFSGDQPACVVADPNNIVVNADISMTDVANVQAGQSAQMTMYFGSETLEFTGTVLSVAMEANKEQGGNGSMPTFPAVISIDPVEGQTLRPDFSVDYKITTAQSVDCITVPSSAVVNTLDGTAVFVRPAEGQTFDNAQPIPEGAEVPEGFVLVPVEVGIADSTNTEILSGIDEGDEVLLAGPADLYEDMNEDMNMDASVAVG